jgi:Domain of unknown function (DUF397)
MELSGMTVWRKSSYSQAQGNCVEVGGDSGQVAVRDTKNRAGVTLAIGAAAWSKFTATLR